MEALNFLEKRHVESIREAGDDPEDWLPESQIRHFVGVVAGHLAEAPPEVQRRYADAPRDLAARMAEAAKEAYSRYEQLPRFWELLQVKREVEESYEAVRRRLERPRKMPYFVGTIHRGSPSAVTESVTIDGDPFCRELILIEAGLFAYFSSVSQAFCHLLGGTPFRFELWHDSLVARDFDAVRKRLHPQHRAVQNCIGALDTYQRQGWLSTTPDLELSDDFHKVHEYFVYGPMIQFVFAHEYGHLSGHLHPSSDDDEPHDIEYESDVLALNILSESMLRTLQVPLSFSTWPAWIALAALRALIVRRSTDPEPVSETHPTFADRAKHLADALTKGAELKPAHAAAFGEAKTLADLVFRWTSAIFDLAHEQRRARAR